MRALVTGGSRGLGLACARELRARGWEVAVAARTAERVRAAADELEGAGHVLDVADPAAFDGLGPFDALVCAAGVIGPIGPSDVIDPRAFVHAYEVNVLGVLNALRTVPKGAPVVAFSGGGATRPFARFDAYAASKAGLVRLVENLAADGHRINAVAPAFVVTEMQDAVLAAGPERVGAAYFAKVRDAVQHGGGEDPSLAARCVAWLLSESAEGVAGRLIAARWDPWQDGAWAARLRSDADLATLRRIDDEFFTSVARERA